MTASDRPGPARFRDAFAVGEFRVLWTAYALSVAGDQLAAVALSVLVFNRTGSPALAALTYAMTFLPDLAGGPLLSGLADLFPRRRVMVVADVARACLVAVMALPHQSLVGLVALLLVVQLLSSPFTAARGAIVPAMLTGDRYVAGMTIMRTTYQLGSVVGFAVGGAVVAGLGTSGALLVDAATFVASALLVSLGVRLHRPSAASGHKPSWWGTISAGWHLVIGDRRLRSLVGLACVSGAYVVPEGLAVSYAAQIHGHTAAVGLLMAASPAGMVIGMLVLQKLRPETRLKLFGPLAVATCLVLVPTWWAPPLAIAVLLWAISGIGSAYNMVTQASFVQAVPDQLRGQALGLANAALRVAQGVGILGAGLFAQLFKPGTVIGAVAAIGVILALLTANAWQRASTVHTAS
ncbi:MAG TPA: MFS transporter [Pseudonocardiaceae bacterium]|nr:MFS transporter [Pseudonocardiaceae bacterium]